MDQRDDLVKNYGYYRFAQRLRMARYTALFVFLIFTAILFFAFRQEMTMNHFRYLLRNIDFSSNVSLFAGDTIYYNGDDESEYGFVSGGLAVVTDARVFVTDRASGTTFSQHHGYQSPRLVSSKKYMLVYDRSGSSLSVFNAFSHVKSFEYKGTVVAAAAADDGTIAVAVLGEDSYYSTVYVYSASFELLNTVSKYKYVTSLDLSESGDSLVIASVYADDSGEVRSEILYLDVGKKRETAKIDLENEAVWQVSFFANDSFAVLSDKALLVYDDDGDCIKRVSYPETPSGAFVGKDGVLLLVSTADSRYQSIYLYDNDGDLDKKNYALGGTCDSIAEDGKYYYLAVGQEVLTIEKDGDSPIKAKLPKDAGKLVSDGENVYYATSSYAKVLDKKAIGR